MQNKLSLCMVTYNEEKNINRSLASVIDWVDEVVIVDGKSTDDTVKMAKKFGAKVKVYKYDNPDNFLINRSRAISKAKNPWVLVLDADEVVSPNLKKEIEKALTLDSKIAYYIPRLNYFLGKGLKKGGQYPDYCLRLFIKKYAQQTTKTIHDQVKISGGPEKIGYLKNYIEHFPYRTFEVYLRKWIQYSSFEADDLIRQGIKPNFVLAIKYCFLYPKYWFLKTYFRHKGFMDGFNGFVFSWFSALRFFAIYIKLYEKNRHK